MPCQELLRAGLVALLAPGVAAHGGAVGADDVPASAAARGGVGRQDLEPGLGEVVEVLDALGVAGTNVEDGDRSRNHAAVGGSSSSRA